jgi:hypothetical protein
MISLIALAHGSPYKRGHLVALRTIKISASDPPSTWWPGEQRDVEQLADDVGADGVQSLQHRRRLWSAGRSQSAKPHSAAVGLGAFTCSLITLSVRRDFR